MYRTLLFAPGSRPELLAKSQLGEADALIFDLEDSVTQSAKAQARQNIGEVLAAGLKKPMFLRINHPSSGDYSSDLQVLVHAQGLSNVAGVILPKAQSAEDIRHIDDALSQLEKQVGMAQGVLRVLPLVETCEGLRKTYEMAKASARVCGMSLASAEQGDYMVDLGGHWTPRSLALMYPRSKMVVDTRAAGLQWLVDGVFMNLKDLDALRTECQIAKELGFVGKMAIHPSQVTLMHEVFSPSSEEIEFARGLLEAYREGEARGVGAVTYRGMMVDFANVRLAQRTLSLAGTR